MSSNAAPRFGILWHNILSFRGCVPQYTVPTKSAILPGASPQFPGLATFFAVAGNRWMAKPPASSRQRHIFSVAENRWRCSKGITGRWFGGDNRTSYEARTGQPEPVGQHHLQRDQVLLHNRKFIRVLSMRVKGYNKWRLPVSAPATNESIVHAVAARASLGTFTEDDTVPVKQRYQKYIGNELSAARFILSLQNVTGRERGSEDMRESGNEGNAG
eukprot:GHVU01032499.1.p1 GENE.GHVU01032499.1~~GHVU01032499.1.p1  ORF type:complete len:216 (+),score=7.95 GHVU01032499.1:145-792(+)